MPRRTAFALPARFSSVGHRWTGERHIQPKREYPRRWPAATTLYRARSASGLPSHTSGHDGKEDRRTELIGQYARRSPAARAPCVSSSAPGLRPLSPDIAQRKAQIPLSNCYLYGQPVPRPFGPAQKRISSSYARMTSFRGNTVQRMQGVETEAITLDVHCYHDIEVKKFNGDLKKNKNCSHYILIKSTIYSGWHVTIPIPSNMTKLKAKQHPFTEYHVTKEMTDNEHYYYKVLHQRDHCDPEILKPEWNIADAVSKEIFGTGDY